MLKFMALAWSPVFYIQMGALTAWAVAPAMRILVKSVRAPRHHDYFVGLLPRAGAASLG
jgi:hypothetical protein